MASIKESHYNRTYVALYMYTNSAVVQYCLSIELIEYLIKTLARGIKKILHLFSPVRVWQYFA